MGHDRRCYRSRNAIDGWKAIARADLAFCPLLGCPNSPAMSLIGFARSFFRHKWRRNRNWGRDQSLHELERAESDPGTKFARGDSRETKHSDLYSIESHLYSRGSGGS